MKAPVRAGDLRHRISIQAPVREPDGLGGAVLTWTPVADVWAAIWSRTASEAVLLDRPAGTATHDIWVRYRDGIVPDMRIVSGPRVFNVLGVIDTEDRRRWLKCIVEERDL